VTTHLYVISSTLRDSDDPGRARPHDAVLFSCSTTGITKVLDNGFQEQQVLRRDGIDTATTFQALADGLREVDDFHWVDLYAGTYIPKGEVDLGELDEKVLSYFDQWVRSGYPSRGHNRRVVTI